MACAEISESSSDMPVEPTNDNNCIALLFL